MAQAFAVTQSFFDAGVENFQILDHIPDGVPLYIKGLRSICKFTQQRWNPNNRQFFTLCSSLVPPQRARVTWAAHSCVHRWRGR